MQTVLQYSEKNEQSTASGEMLLSILMPCLNEAATVGTCVRKAIRFLSVHDIEGEVIVADNGSRDGSREIAIQEGARVIEVQKKGYGNALRAGIQAANGRYVIMGDADDSYDFSSLEPFVSALTSGGELVMGNRFQGGIEKNAMPFLHRYLGNPVLSGLGRLFFNSSIGDFHCGLRGFDREKIRKLGLMSPGMEFASEMVIKATIWKYKIVEVPTKLYKDGRGRPPHLRTWQDGWRHLVFLLIYSPKWLFFIPSLFFFLLSITGILLLLPGTLQLGVVNLNIHTLTVVGFTAVMSYQLFLFAVIFRLYSIQQGLYPPRFRHKHFSKLFTLEKRIVTGVLSLISGLLIFIKLVSDWAGSGFGEIFDVGNSFRYLIPSLTLMSMGVLTIFSSFVIAMVKNRKYLKE